MWTSRLDEDPRREMAKGLLRKFQAESRALAQRFEAQKAAGRHTYEKGLRNEQVLIDWLSEMLPPCYGVGRGEVVDSTGQIARQCDVVIYDALHAPLLQTSAASQVFPAESVYAVIELKPSLAQNTMREALGTLESVKRLEASAVVRRPKAGEHILWPQWNPPIFTAIFALRPKDVSGAVKRALMAWHRERPRRLWVDCVCVLGGTLVTYFARRGGRWVPCVLYDRAELGSMETGESTLYLFYLFLLNELNLRVLKPPDLLAYTTDEALSRPVVWPLKDSG